MTGYHCGSYEGKLQLSEISYIQIDNESMETKTGHRPVIFHVIFTECGVFNKGNESRIDM